MWLCRRLVCCHCIVVRCTVGDAADGCSLSSLCRVARWLAFGFRWRGLPVACGWCVQQVRAGVSQQVAWSRWPAKIFSFRVLRLVVVLSLSVCSALRASPGWCLSRSGVLFSGVWGSFCDSGGSLCPCVRWHVFAGRHPRAFPQLWALVRGSVCSTRGSAVLPIGGRRWPCGRPTRAWFTYGLGCDDLCGVRRSPRLVHLDSGFLVRPCLVRT